MTPRETADRIMQIQFDLEQLLQKNSFAYFEYTNATNNVPPDLEKIYKDFKKAAWLMFLLLWTFPTRRVRRRVTEDWLELKRLCEEDAVQNKTP